MLRLGINGKLGISRLEFLFNVPGHIEAWVINHSETQSQVVAWRSNTLEVSGVSYRCRTNQRQSGMRILALLNHPDPTKHNQTAQGTQNQLRGKGAAICFWKLLIFVYVHICLKPTLFFCPAPFSLIVFAGSVCANYERTEHEQDTIREGCLIVLSWALLCNQRT